MFKQFIYITVLVFCIISCKNGSNANPPLKAKDTLSNTPIIELLQNDVDDVLKTPYYLYIKTTNIEPTKSIDSIALSRDEFKKLVQPILQINLHTQAAKESYKEEAFQDFTTHSYSFVINAINNNTAVKNITALFNDETNRLKTCYITIENVTTDSTTTKKYFWKNNKSINIITETKYKNNSTKTFTQFINWNDKEYK